MNNESISLIGNSNTSLEIDEIIRRLVETIELNLNKEGLYLVPGSPVRITKINKKLMKKKSFDLDKYKADVYELCSCLKAYIQGQEPLVTASDMNQVLKHCGK